MGSGKAGGDTRDYPWSPGFHSPPRPVVDLSLGSHRRVGWERLDQGEEEPHAFTVRYGTQFAF